MARTSRRKRKPAAAVPSDALAVSIAEYLEWIAVHYYSEQTVETRRLHLGYFHAWCVERGLCDAVEITRPILERHQRWLFHYRKKDGSPLGFGTQHTRLQAVKSYFQWMARQNRLLHNPASEIVLPRIGVRLPKHVLTAEEAERVLAQPDVAQPEGLRDRALLETFYATGMRRMELAHLKMWDIDGGRGTVTIHQGKGRKDRVVPLGERALAWAVKYMREARHGLQSGTDDGTLFLNQNGEEFTLHQLTGLVRRWIVKAKTGKPGSCHLFRHTMATLMLENGADVRVIQQILGHAKLSTTEIYTHVTINLLRQVHLATHPGVNLKRPAVKAEDAAAAAELITELAAEAEEEDV